MTLLSVLIIFTLGVIAQPLTQWLFDVARSEWRDHQLRRKTFKIQSSITVLESNGWRLIPPDEVDTLILQHHIETNVRGVPESWAT